MKKKLLSILLTACMLLTLLPTAALADGVTPRAATGIVPRTTTLNLETDADLSYAATDGTTKTANPTTTSITDSAEGWSWDLSSQTLTLSGANITAQDAAGNTSYGIYMPSTVTTITLAPGTTSMVRGGAGNASYGILAGGRLTIDGSGALQATGGKGVNSSFGISGGNLAIASGTVTATGGTVTAANDDASGEAKSHGIYVSGDATISGTATVTATGGTVTATGSKTAKSYGIYAHVTVGITGGTVTATGGTVTAAAESKSYGIFSTTSSVAVTGGTVTATGGTAGTGSYGIFAATDVTATGGTVTVSGGMAGNNSYGIFTNTGKIEISNGTVTAIGGTSISYSSAGISAATTVTISGGTVTSTGGTAPNRSYGILASNDVTISGSATVTATGGTAGSGSYGIASDSSAVNVTTTGVVTATGGDNAMGGQPIGKSYGIYAATDVTVSDGTVTATGGTAGDYSYGIEASNAVLNGGLVIARSGTATGTSSALDKAATGTLALLTGAYDANFAVYGESGKYYVIDSKATGDRVSGGNLKGHTQISGAIGLDFGTTQTIPSGTNAANHFAWDAPATKLTLTDVIINVDTASLASNTRGIELPSPATTIITLSGTNIVRGGDTSGWSYGIYGDTLTINGTGTLHSFGGTSTNIKTYGIFANTTVNISDGANVTATGGTGWASYGIYACGGSGTGFVNISDRANVTATGGTASGSSISSSYGIGATADVNISGSATVTVTAGSSSESNFGIDAGKAVTISGGTVTVTGGTTDYSSLGIYAPSGAIGISGTAKVTATGGTAGAGSLGIEAGNAVTISGGTVTVTGGTAGTDSLGIFSYRSAIGITGGTVTANGGTSTGSGKSSCGISVATDVTISGTAKVTATGGTATGTDGTSTGISAVTDVTISGGTVTAAGGSATNNSYGIYATNAINLSGGTGTAKTTETAAATKRAFDKAPTLTGVVLTPPWVSGTPVASASWGAPTYSITSAATSNGSFAVKVGGSTVTTAAENDTVTIVPAPASGYEVDTVEVKQTADPFAPVAVTSNTFTMPAYGVTVTVTFKAAPVPPPPSGGNDDDDYTPTYTVTNDTAKTENGTVTLSKTRAQAGETVKLTPKAAEGYEVDTLIVKDSKGNIIPVTKSADGTFSFKMPGGKVTLEATFKAIEAEKPVWVNPFSDVKETDWHYGAVAYAHQNKLFEGTGADTFSPDATMTRAMLWTVLGRLDGQTLTGSGVFDAAKDWAVGKGITDGTDPSGNITREQLVTILWRYAGSPKAGGDLSAFADAAAVSDYAKDAMAWAVETGILTGSNGSLLPADNATRAQVAAILMRYEETVKK